MKRFIVVALMLFSILGMGSAVAQTSAGKAAPAIPTLDETEARAIAARLQPFYSSLEKHAGNSFSAPAPQLTYLEAYAVISSQHPTYEYLSQYQYSTSSDHGGANLYIVTIEYGYGSNPIARLNGGTLTQVQSQAITNSSGTIIGWFRWWDASGYQNGQFTYQNTSINSPWNTMYDQVSIL
jgi:hypothetical protein